MIKNALMKKKKLFASIVVMLVLFTISLVEEQLIYLLICSSVIFSLFVSLSDSFALLAFCLSFKTCFGDKFNIFITIYLFILAIRSFILFKEDKWDKKNKVFKIISLGLLCYLLFEPIINSVIVGKFNFSNYLSIVALVSAILVIYLSFGKVNLNSITICLALGLVASSLTSLLYVATDIVDVKNVFLKNGEIVSFSAFCNSFEYLAILSCLSLIMLTAYCLKNSQTMAYVFFLPISFIGLFSFSKLFILMMTFNLIVGSVLISIKRKNTEKKSIISISIVGVSIALMLVAFAILFRDELGLFSGQIWRDIFISRKDKLKVCWDLIKNNSNLAFGMPLNMFNMIELSNGILAILCRLGVVGSLILLVLLTISVISNKNCSKNILSFGIFLNILLLALIFNALEISILAIFSLIILGFSDFNEAQEIFQNVEWQLAKDSLYRFIKRAFDIIIAIVGLVIACIPMLIVALLVKTTSKGPVFFKDKRIGKGGKPIVVLKFRSMYQDAEARLEQYLTKEQLEMWKKERKVENDPRITKVGKIIRKTSLDELPQLINILKGDLSIVGNRPVSKLEYDTHFNKEEQKLLDKMRPGLTGYWQVYGRSDVTYINGARQEMYLKYVKEANIWLDIKLFFMTFVVVLLRKGAR